MVHLPHDHVPDGNSKLMLDFILANLEEETHQF